MIFTQTFGYPGINLCSSEVFRGVGGVLAPSRYLGKSFYESAGGPKLAATAACGPYIGFQFTGFFCTDPIESDVLPILQLGDLFCNFYIHYVFTHLSLSLSLSFCSSYVYYSTT